MRRRFIAVATFSCFLLISGCSSVIEGNANLEPAKTSTRPSRFVASNLPQAGAPKVENPLSDVQYFLDYPCASLTPEQTVSLGVSANGTEHLSAGKACDWKNPQTSASVGVIWENLNPKGLSAFYERKAEYDLFGLQDPIDGLPILIHYQKDLRDIGGCLVNVGVTDDLTFQVNLSLARNKVGSVDPCNAAHDVATMAITTIKRGPHA